MRIKLLDAVRLKPHSFYPRIAVTVDTLAPVTVLKIRKEKDLLERLITLARITFMYSVFGTDSEGFIREDAMPMVLSLIEAHTPKK